MHLIKLHRATGPIVVNMDLVEWFFPIAGGTRLGFPGSDNEYIDVTEPYEEIMWAFDSSFPIGNLEEKNG